ncbi:Bbp19 family protein [Nitrosovibrio sp. Nv4]|uniref:Bbp19 family protein n=1 Tax=Nitrosovibrio sp. Nv4 TaxID=1945880 RepID=UPI000BC8AF4B|nr:hypothetical protein [Nitrosovibrio sp. Nv4]SOD41328.1 hypothetical protein SAMN06298226_1623 [Nitrosovibrio sp. Nv4]
MLAEQLERLKDFLKGRAGSYRRVFNKESVDVDAVLTDLAKFCRANASTAHPDPHMAARLDGRREVWLRISEHLNLSTEDLYRRYSGSTLKGPNND